MAKEYFSHDYNTRADEKIKNLIRKHGMLGYGIFWALVEDLYQNENSLSLDYDGIAYDLRVDSNTVESIVNDFGLFCLDEGFISSNSIGERINIRLEKSKTATNNALKRRTPSSVPAEKCIFYAIRIYDESEEFIKAGITTESVSRRYSGKLNGYKYSLIISHDIDLQEAINLENMVSEKCLKYSPFRKFPGFLECYNISELDKINKIAMQIKPIRNAIKEKKRKEKNIKEYEIKEKESVLTRAPEPENSNFKSSDSEIPPTSQPEQKKQTGPGRKKHPAAPVSLEDWGDRERFDASVPEDWPPEKRDHYWEALLNYSNKGHKFKDWVLTARSWARKDEKQGSTPREYSHTHQKPKESPTQTDDITRIIDEFNALTQSQYNPADEAIRGYLVGRLMDGCQLQDMLDVIALKAVQWGFGDSRKYLKFHILFKPEKYPGYVQEVKDAKAGKIKVLNPNESRYDRIQRKLDAALGRTQPS